MDNMLVAIFDNETAADAGLQALHKLHAHGDIRVYATGVIAKDATGLVSVKKSMAQGPVGRGVGMAVGSLMGLLGGPAGLAVGGLVCRRTRTEVAEAQLDDDIAAFKAEIKALESEAAHAGAAAKRALKGKIADAEGSLDAAVRRAQQRVDALRREADAKADSLKAQLNQATGDAKARIEDRVKRVTSAHHARGAKLSPAWTLAKEALAI